MIRFERGKPPASLEQTRRQKISLLRQLKKEEKLDEGTNDFIGYGTEEVRRALFAAQHGKCPYCEIMVLRRGYHIEHFRPKGKADRGPSFPTHGYFWLAWSWENLLLVCPACNGAKLISFPLDPGSRVLPRWHQPPGKEKALLIDPAREDPLDEIRFERRNDQWRPFPRDGALVISPATPLRHPREGGGPDVAEVAEFTGFPPSRE